MASGTAAVRIVAAMLTLYVRVPVVVWTMLLSWTVIGQLGRPEKMMPNRKSFQMPVTCRMTATIGDRHRHRQHDAEEDAARSRRRRRAPP